MENRIKSTLLLFAWLSVCTTGQAQIGNTAPNFTALDTHGDTIRLYDILNQGKYVILDFYYTTCGPCIYYSPQVNLAYEKYGCNTQDVVFLAIDYNDTNAEVEAYDAQYGIKYPSISGTQGGGNGIVSQYGITGFPTFYLIDSTHHIIDQIDPPTLQVFDFRFNMHSILPMQCLSGTTQAQKGEPIRIFPNPVSSGALTLDLTEIQAGPVEVRVMDLLGNIIRPFNLSGGQFESIHCPDWPAGLYQINITDQHGAKWRVQFAKM